jgi:alpha-methylacyl-CoA racemase
MVDGSALMLADVLTMAQAGGWRTERGTNSFDAGSHFYEVYETADGRYMAVGAFEPQFYAEVLEHLEIDDVAVTDQFDRAQWPRMKERFAAAFASRTQAEWVTTFESVDACVSPVLSYAEAPADPHLAQRGTFVEVDGRVQPAPAPRFGRSGTRPPGTAPLLSELLESWRVPAAPLSDLLDLAAAQ